MSRYRSHTRAFAATLTLVACLGSLAACGRGGNSPIKSGGATSGAAIPTSPGFDGKTISLGIIGVTSGPLAAADAPLIAAQQAFVEQLDASGGIDGKYPVKLDITDSGYAPAQAIQQYIQSKNSVAMYANIFGTPIVAALLPDLGSDNILAIAGTGDGTFLRKPNLILQFTPYESQILEAIGYELDYGAGGKNTVFCGVGLEGDLYGSVTRAFKYAQQTMGVKVGTNVSVSATTTDATPQVLQLRNAGCRVLVFQAVGATTSAVAAAASQLGYAPQFIVTDTGYQTVKQDDPLYPYLSRHLIQVADMAPYGSKSVPGMADLVAAHDKYAAGTTPTIAYVGAWAMMAAVQQILEKAVAQKDLSQAALVKISSSFTKLDFGGIQAAFPWGGSAARKPPSTYTAYRPDASNPSGVAVIKANLSAPAPAVNYPY